MDFLILVLVVGGTFGLCWLLDRGYTKAFRSAPQHASGQAVRLNKHFGGAGVVILVLGICGILSGITQGALIIAAGCVLVLTGLGLVVYYLTFGVYYDGEGFLLNTFGKKSRTYRYSDICGQQLFVAYGKTVIELYLADGRALQLQQTMTGVYTFMDKAFAAWLRQKGMDRADCPFYDPDNSCWFPPVEDKNAHS
jgi:hypothetical protein